MKIIKNSKSQSQIVGTILLVLISVTLIVIIATFAFNFVNTRISETDCFDVSGGLEFRNNIRYTCYDNINSLDLLRVQVHVGNIPIKLEGFRISVSVGGSSESFDILNDTYELGSRVEMFVPLLPPYAGNLSIPSNNAEKTYNLTLSGTNKPESISIYPLLIDGKTCGASDTLTFIDYCK